jgi:G3E family GTPase
MFLPPDIAGRRLPVLLLTGFLGSGKTTLVNFWLRDPRLAETAVAVNEFGAVPLDAHLIDQGADRTVVLANGCLCCNFAGDWPDAVMRIFARREAGALPDFQRLIIEPSGLADPAPIAQAILRNPIMARAFRLEGIVCTVDSLFGAEQIARHDETANQIALADRLVLTKTDLAPPEALAALRENLRRLNPVADIFEARQGAADAALLPAGFLDPAASVSRSAFSAAPVAPSPAHTGGTAAITLTADQPLRWRAVEAWLRRIRLGHAEQLLRVKGILNVADSTAPVVIHGVHHVLHAPETLAAWPDGDRRTRIVLILRGADPAAIAADWANALPGLYAVAIAA